ncbi:hypothetical protein [Halomonas sp.]|uniref:hypothetical protein n=1 Tax=Halomonas sp. TaxID=1486246 RepID=UPI00356B16FD
MPEYSFLVRKEDNTETEYRTRGNALSAQEAVDRTYERYPNGKIIKQLYGSPVPDSVDVLNPNLEGEQEADDDGDQTVAESVTEDGEEEDDAAMVPPPIDPAEFTVKEVRAELAERDMSDGELRGLRVSEEGGENRVTVIDAIDDRLNGE